MIAGIIIGILGTLGAEAILLLVSWISLYSKRGDSTS